MGAALLLLAALPAHATVIDFEDIGVAPGGNDVGGDRITRGYLVHAADHNHLINNLGDSWNNSTWIGVHDEEDGPSQIVVSQVGGGVFNLLSLQASEFFSTPNGVQLRVTGNLLGGGVLTQTFTLDDIADSSGPLDDFQTVTFGSNWVNLLSVVIDPVAGDAARWYALDNIAVAETPLPATWLLFASGIGLLGLARKARKA
jgi:hypothetical protein